MSASSPMRRVLIASANPWSFCMAVERDVAATEIARGARVDALDLFRLAARCSPHWRRRDKLIETLNRKIGRFIMPAINGRDITPDIAIDSADIPPLPGTYEELRAYKHDGAKVGLAVLSTVSSLTTIQFPRTLAEFGPALAPAWRSAHLSLRAGQAARMLGYDRLWMFNGRHCYSRPFCDVVERDSEVVRYEQGSAGNRYVQASSPVHHPSTMAGLIEAHDFDPLAGEQYFRERIEPGAANEVGIINALQNKGALPEHMPPGPFVSFFTSSSDEMFAITDDPPYGSLGSQHGIALALSDACRAQGLGLVVRFHPHLRFKHPAWRREWNFEELERRGVTIVGPSDSCDSYALLRASRCVVTAGSTVGVEASFLGVPNAVVGTWVGGCIGASAEANSASELEEFVASPSLPPGARNRALMFGSFYKRGGKLLPELGVGIHPSMARIDGRIVDPVRYLAQKLRFALRPLGDDPDALDIRSGMQAGRVVLAPGTDYSPPSKRR